jgi:cytoplasmic iron level regulating protein YaaA (DUF328/UPF0246 family)
MCLPFASLRRVLILLPPSEGKSAALTGPAVDPTGLSFPELAPARQAVLTAVVELCRGDVDVAAATLGLGPTQRGEVGANSLLRAEPCAPAIEVYTGVLYEALDYAGLTVAGRRRADEQLAIASALWGLVRPGDLIPAYRLSAGTTLPGLGPVARAWRAPVSSAIASVEDLIVDLRSGGYVALGPVPASAADRTVTVRVLQERNGRRTVVSHFNKATKGRMVRALLSSRRTPRTPAAFVEALAALDFRVECEPTSRGRPTSVDVIVDEP